MKKWQEVESIRETEILYECHINSNFTTALESAFADDGLPTQQQFYDLIIYFIFSQK